MKTHRAIAPDLPGQGSSEITDPTLDADGVLTWLGELIEHACPSPPALVGYALGGAIAARFAAHVNFQTADEDDDRIRAGYGANFDRLVGLKKQSDPGNLFRSNRNVR